MKAHLIDTHLLVPRSKSSAKVKVKYQGHVSQKVGVSGALVFHKHILVFFVRLEGFEKQKTMLKTFFTKEGELTKDTSLPDTPVFKD